jgi:hypothetical protein
MSFNFFATKRFFRVGQYDGIDDFVAFDLSGEKRRLVQFLVGEFHSSAICKRFNPLVAHSAPPRGDSVEITWDYAAEASFGERHLEVNYERASCSLHSQRSLTF